MSHVDPSPFRNDLETVLSVNDHRLDSKFNLRISTIRWTAWLPTILWKNSSWKEGKGELMTRDNKNSLEPPRRFCGRTSSWPNSANFFHPVPHALWDQLFKMPVISIFNEPGWNPQAPRQIYLPRSNDSDRIREINRVKLEGKAPLDFSRLFEERERER